MNDQNKKRMLATDPIKRNWQPGRWPKTLIIAFILAATVFGVRSVSAQTVPVMTIASAGTNQYSITFTNNIGMLDYDLMWTPVLANPNYPWSFAAVGVPGGTNFILNTAGYPSGFFRAASCSRLVAHG